MLYSLHKLKVEIILFQETDFCLDAIPTLCNRYHSTWFHSTYSGSRSRGVPIAIHKSLPYQVLAQQTDPEGRCIFLKIFICEKTYIIVIVYLTNHDQVASGFQTLRDLDRFAEGSY